MIILKERIFNLNRPRYNSEKDLQLFSPELTQRFKEVQIIKAKNYNVSCEGIIFKAIKIHPSSFIWDHQKEVYGIKYLIKQYLLYKRKKVSKDAFLCFDNWTIGYYHWMCDYLPRYIVCKEFIDKDVIQLIPSEFNKDFMISTLKIFNEHKIDYIQKQEFANTNLLYIPDRPFPSGCVDKNLLQIIKQKILSYFNIKEEPPSRKIYVSRNKALRRKIKNDSEIELIFKKYGYEIVHFEDYSFVEQVKLSASAKIIAGLHGANLVNCLFMNKGMQLFEFRLLNYSGSDVYYNLAQANELDYNYCFTKLIEPEKSFYINPEQVESIINKNKLF